MREMNLLLQVLVIIVYDGTLSCTYIPQLKVQEMQELGMLKCIHIIFKPYVF